jgi:hypothetical protein
MDMGLVAKDLDVKSIEGGLPRWLCTQAESDGQRDL